METWQILRRLCPCGRGATASLYHRYCARCIRGAAPLKNNSRPGQADDDERTGGSFGRKPEGVETVHRLIPVGSKNEEKTKGH